MLVGTAAATAVEPAPRATELATVTFAFVPIAIPSFAEATFALLPMATPLALEVTFAPAPSACA